MTISVNFTGQADESPWVDALFNQSNPGSTDLSGGRIFQPLQSTNNLVSFTADSSVNRSLSVDVYVLSYIAASGGSYSSHYYVDYTDASNYIRADFTHPSTNINKLEITAVVGGVQVLSQTFGSYSDAYFSSAVFSLGVTGTQNGANYDLAIELDADSYSMSVPDFSPTGKPTVNVRRGASSSNFARIQSIAVTGEVAGTDYTVRKGATAVPITHTLTAGGITSQTFNGEAVALASQSGQIANVDFTDTITTSGVYTLTLGDGATTQNFDVQYNVIGLTSDQLLKDGAAQASLSDLELIVLTGAEGSRAVPEQESSLTTDASGNTGQTILNDTGIVDATAVFVIWNSASADTRWAYPTTAGLL